MDLSLLLSNLPYLLVGAYPDGPLGGAALSLMLAIASAIASAVLGVALGVAMALARGPVRVLLLAFIGFFRAIPVLMLIFWTYFLMPVLLHMDVPGARDGRLRACPDRRRISRACGACGHRRGG